MKLPNRSQSGKMSHYNISGALITLLAQLRSRYSCTDTSTTHHQIVPFDLGDVAQAFSGALASRFAYLEDPSED